MSSLIVPALYLLIEVFKENYYIFYAILLGVLGICFILKVKIPKPNKIATIILAIVGTAIAVTLITLFIINRAK